MRQFQYEKGSWNGDEIATFRTLKEAIDYVEKVAIPYYNKHNKVW